MGMTATQEALARLKESDPAAHSVLEKFWQMSFGTLTHMAFDAELNEAQIDQNNSDAKFIIEQINRNISSQ